MDYRIKVETKVKRAIKIQKMETTAMIDMRRDTTTTTLANPQNSGHHINRLTAQESILFFQIHKNSLPE